MTTGLYLAGKAAILRGTVSLGSDSIRLLPVTAGYVPDLATHATLTDVPEGNRSATGTALANRTFTTASGLARFDAADTVLPAVPSGDPVSAFVLYKHTGVDATSLLIGYFDNFANLPITPDGRDIVATWPETIDRIFSW